MLATNPVQPHQLSHIDLVGPAGPNSPWPRRVENEPFPIRKFLLVGALLVAGYAVAGTVAADGQPGAERIPAPVAKVAPHIEAPVMAPVRGEFRLGPGNSQPQGVVVRLIVPEPIPGDFRLGPGNDQPPGLVTAR